MKLISVRSYIFMFSLVLCLSFLITAPALKSKSIKHKHRSVIQEVPRDDNYNFPAQIYQDVTDYNLHIDLYPADKQIKGIAKISVLVAEGCDSVILNFYENMIIESLTVDNQKAEYYRLPRHLIVKLPQGSAGNRKIEVIYNGTPYNLGFSSFTFGNINNNSLIFTINEPYFASTWFPCNDIPCDKATATLAITNDSQYVSVSNGKPISETISGKRKTYTWRSSYAIAPYLLTLYSSRYKKISSSFKDPSGVVLPLEYYVIPKHLDKASKDFEDTPQMLEVFTKLFGQYPFLYEKYGIAEFLWQGGAMENQTITGIGTNFITGNKLINDILVHELAHHWWGNAISPRSWDDIWLNEGFATYSEALYTEVTEGKDAFLNMIRQWNRGYYPEKVYAPKDDIFSNSVYKKGALILHALRGEIGDSAFFLTLKSYYMNYRYSFASVNDFQMVAEAVSKKELGLFFNQWLYNEGESPSINVEWARHAGGKNSIFLTVTQLQNADVYTLPLELVILGEEKNERLTKHFTIENRKTVIEISTDFKVKSILPDPSLFIPGVVTVTDP